MPINIVLENDAPDIKRVEPFALPVAPEELRERLDRLGFTPQVMDEITVSATLVDRPLGNILIEFGEYEPLHVLNLDELNCAAALYDALDDAGKEKFSAVMEYIERGYSRYSHDIGSANDTIDILLNLDKFEYLPGVRSLNELGKQVLEGIRETETEDERRYANPNPDPRIFAEADIRNNDGCFTATGYVRGGGKGFEPHTLYNGVPEEHRVWEKAFSDLPPFENPVQIDYEELSEGHADEWQFHMAHDLFEHFVAAGTPGFVDGDHKHRGRRIIEPLTIEPQKLSHSA